MESFNQPPPFQSASPRAQWTKYLLLAGIVVSAMSIITDLLEIHRFSGVSGSTSLEEFSQENLGLLDFANLGVALTTIVVTVATVVLFLMWMHRAYRNLKPLGAKGRQYSPGWAVGAWFIPFGNLFIPIRIAKELWTKSDPEMAEFGFLSSDSTVPGFFGLWWGFWVTHNIANNVATRLSFRADTVGEQFGATVLDLLAEVLSIPAALFAMRVINSIDLRQTHSSKRLPQSIYPPPPVYGPSHS